MSSRPLKNLDVYTVNILNHHVLIMQDFEGVGFGCCFDSRASPMVLNPHLHLHLFIRDADANP